MSITQEYTDFRDKVQGMLGENFSIVTGDMQRVRESGLVEHALKVGESAPDFSLPDVYGNQVTLTTLIAKGPVVVSFYRGEWCPFCNIELRGLQMELPKMQELGATLVAISPELPDHGVVMAEKNNLTFPVLTDSGNSVARQFGIVYRIGDELEAFSKNVFKNDLALRNGEDSYELPVPATFVVDTLGFIRFAHVNVDYMVGRVDPEEIIAILRKIA